MSETIRRIDAQVAAARRWDVVVAGGGMGGAAAAHRLVELGHEVLLVEKGLSSASLEGCADSEKTHVRAGCSAHVRNFGRWNERVRSIIDGRTSDLMPILGCGVGGSTLLYAATLGRLDPIDFEERRFPDGRTGGWPITYDDIEPYYRLAERLFEVSGTPDPLQASVHYELSEPPAMNECDRHLFGSMQKAGLHPYRVHLSMRYVDGCLECGGHFCPRDCKGDARNRLVIPASRSGRLYVLDQTRLASLESQGNSVDSALAIHDGAAYQIRAQVFVLAAGALMTPILLLNSHDSARPSGIGNDSHQVGRNLMFHASDLIAVWPRQRLSRQGPRRSIALRDFYVVDGRKLGELQSMGVTAGYGDILTNLHMRFDQSILRAFQPLRHLLRIPAYVGARVLKEATVFATIVEDHPYLDNRVVPDSASESGMRFEYHIHDELRARVVEMRGLVREAFRDHRVMQMTYDVSLNFGHPCGTCRMGCDPDSSVVDDECRVHGMDNLYIADGSVMPTSGGTNPSLTIAANALRVADRISAKHMI